MECNDISTKEVKIVIVFLPQTKMDTNSPYSY